MAAISLRRPKLNGHSQRQLPAGQRPSCSAVAPVLASLERSRRPWPQAGPTSESSPILISWIVPEGDGFEARVGRGLCRAGDVIRVRRDRSAYTMRGRLLPSARQRSINGSTACAVLADGAASGGEGNVPGCAMRVICRAMIMQVDTLLRRVGIWTNWHLGVIRNTSMVCLRPPAPDGLGSRVTR